MVIVSVQDLMALYGALIHAVSATISATNTLAISSKRMQKACYKTFHMTNTITLRMANIKSLVRDISNAIAMCSNGQQCQQGNVLCTAQQHSQAHGSKRSAAKQMVQRIVHSQSNAQPKCTQTQHTPITPAAVKPALPASFSGKMGDTSVIMFCH